jgi:hypothetical protein
MSARRLLQSLCAAALCVGAASPALALANRVFVAARTGNNLNSCDSVSTPCQTLAGAVVQLNPDGEVIVLESGGYGPVTITQGVTIEAPAGVTAFIHPPAGDAITVNAGLATVTLKGLTLNVGPVNGIIVNSVGTLNVVSSSITGFPTAGIEMLSGGRLNVKGTNITGCQYGVRVANTAGLARVSIADSHLDGNSYGFFAATTAPGGSTTTATFSTANNNDSYGWVRGGGGNTGVDVLNVEFCTGSANGVAGLWGNSPDASSSTRYSNCVFSNNALYGVRRFNAGTVQTRGNNTIRGNGTGPTDGTIDPFSGI